VTRRLVIAMGTALAMAIPTARAVAQRVAADSARGALPPAGYGTLKRDDVAIIVQSQGLTIRAIPLDESVLRLLAPDSYRTLRALRESKRKALDAAATRLGIPRVAAWFVEYFNVEAGEARYDAYDLQLRSAGRDFRPLDVYPITPGFGDGRLGQRQRMSAVYAFDPAVDLTQRLILTAASQQSTAWDDDLLARLSAERAAVWGRAK
jgi:hypothetical protein